MIATLLVFILFCLGVGATALHANPRRFANQAFALNSVVIAAWMGCIAGAIWASVTPGSGGPLPWLRLNGALTGFLPGLTFLLVEAVDANRTRWQILARSWPLMVFAAIVAPCCWTDAYLPATSRPEHHERGWLYPVLVVTALALFGWVLAHTVRRMRTMSGVRRVEITFLALNLAITFPLTIAVTAIGTALDLTWCRRASVFILLAAFALGGWALTFHRTYNARQLVVSLLQRLIVILTMSAGVWAASLVLAGLIPNPAHVWLAAALCVIAAFWLDEHSRRWLDLTGERHLANVRARVVALARTEPSNDHFIAEFEQLVQNDCRAAFAAVLVQRGDTFVAGNLQIRLNSAAIATLTEAGWVTPETLDRRPRTPGVVELQQLMAAQSVGMIVTVPRGTPHPSLLVALGVKRTRWPFTHPEVVRVQEIAAIVDNFLVRSRLIAEESLKTKIDHLAMMSRGLAHDLKNLITPISSFLVHTTGHQPPGSAEEEVHAAATRSVAIIAEYVNEALFFARRLTPNFQQIAVRDLFATVSEITAARAGRRNVALATCVQAETVTADRVLLQRVLCNLLNNAVDASAPGSNIVLTAGHPGPGLVRFEVRDEGTGIPSENAPYIFEPYFTTKQFGDDTRGFGLGLTICEKVVALHRGTITVRSKVGVGTTVVVDLPLNPPAVLPASEPPAAAGGVVAVAAGEAIDRRSSGRRFGQP